MVFVFGASNFNQASEAQEDTIEDKKIALVDIDKIFEEETGLTNPTPIMEAAEKVREEHNYDFVFQKMALLAYSDDMADDITDEVSDEIEIEQEEDDEGSDGIEFEE